MSDGRDDTIPSKLYDKASTDLDNQIDARITRGTLTAAWRHAATDEQAPYGKTGKPRISDSEREILLAQTEKLAATTPLLGEDRKEESYLHIANLIDRLNMKSDHLDEGLHRIRHIHLHDEQKQASYLSEKSRTTTEQKAKIATVLEHIREQLQDALIGDVRITDAEAAHITKTSLAELKAADLPQSVLDQATKLIPHIATVTNEEKSRMALESMGNDAEYERARLTGTKPRKAFIRE